MQDELLDDHHEQQPQEDQEKNAFEGVQNEQVNKQIQF